MLTATDEHPKLSALIACGRGQLAPEEQRAIEDHVMHCDRCVQTLWKKGSTSQLSLGRAPGPRRIEVPPELQDHPRYRILSTLGTGGMGVVFAAEHRIMRRKVALKVMAERFLTNPDAIERFRREVRAAAKLSHPNIVTAHDADSAGGLHFLVMEYVEGVSLDRVVAKRGQQPVAVACQCIRQAAVGLQHASKLGMVHRDIKPHNLMVTRKGQVKILDFGLARFISESDSSMDTPALPKGMCAASMTSASQVIGTPDYLAPEQARCSKDVDIRADIYGLGCTLYFLLSGRAPFADIPSAFEKMLAHSATEPPKIDDLRGDVPAGLIAILAKMLAKNPDDRYATPAEVAAALQPFTKPGVVLEAEIVEELPPEPPATDLAVTPMPKRRRPKRHRKSKHLARKNWIALGGGVLAVICAVMLGIVLSKVLNRKAGTAETSKSGALAPGAPVVAKKSKVLIVLPNVGVHMDEYGALRDGLEKRGFACIVAAKKRGLCYSGPMGQGPPIMADLALAEVNPSEYDAVAFVGAGVESYMNPRDGVASTVRAIIDKLQSESKPVAAIGRGQMALVMSGYLDNLPAVWNREVQSLFPQRPVKWDREQRAVDSDGLLTADGRRCRRCRRLGGIDREATRIGEVNALCRCSARRGAYDVADTERQR